MTLVAGFGFRAAATAESLADALSKARAAAGCEEPLARVAAPADKAVSPVFTGFAAVISAEIAAVAAADLSAETPTQAPRVIGKRGVGSVAEAAALAAAGPSAKLLAPRAISDDRAATCALAEGK